MDLLDVDSDALYFEKPLAPELEGLLMRAASAPDTPAAELHLLRAFLGAPENLRVLVALFRHYQLAERLPEAANVAERAMLASGRPLRFPEEWRRIETRHLTYGVTRSIGMVRFYLLTLKARACIGLRLKQVETAREMLVKVRELDRADRLGVAALLAVIDESTGPARTLGGAA